MQQKMEREGTVKNFIPLCITSSFEAEDISG